jgi:hypothetical protein
MTPGHAPLTIVKHGARGAFAPGFVGGAVLQCRCDGFGIVPGPPPEGRRLSFPFQFQ